MVRAAAAATMIPAIVEPTTGTRSISALQTNPIVKHENIVGAT